MFLIDFAAVRTFNPSTKGKGASVMGFPFDLCLIAQGRRARVLEKLWEGDPVAWAILIGVIVLVVGWKILKSRRAKIDSGESPEDNAP